MKHWIRNPHVREARPPAVLAHWRTIAPIVMLATGSALLAGCGQLHSGAVTGSAGAATSSAAATASTNLAVAANSGCVQASPVVQSALSVLTQLQHGAVTPAQARPSLATKLADLETLARATPDDGLQESLANAYDAFTAFQAVMQNPNDPAYPGAFFNLLGTLSGFGRTCSVVDTGAASGAGGGAASVNTKLTRSATAHDASWSLEVASTAPSPAMAGFTAAPSSASPTLKGSEQIGLWARALAGTPTVTVEVRELSGSAVVGTQQVTMNLDSTFRFGYLTYMVRRPGASRLSLTISAADLGPRDAFLVDDITMVRD
jgi:hypothetical protein